MFYNYHHSNCYYCLLLIVCCQLNDLVIVFSKTVDPISTALSFSHDETKHRQHCVNGVLSRLKCVCVSGYEGNACDVPICRPNGQLRLDPHTKSHYCKCSRGFFGHFCHKRYNIIKCHNGVEQYGVCVCNRFWSGRQCDWPECGPYSALDSASRQCICGNNFKGQFCRSCKAGYWGRDCSLQTTVPNHSKKDHPTIFNRFNSTDFLSTLLPISLLCLLIVCTVKVTYSQFTRRRTMQPNCSSRISVSTPQNAVHRRQLFVAVPPRSNSPSDNLQSILPSYEQSLANGKRLDTDEAPPSYEEALRL